MPKLRIPSPSKATRAKKLSRSIHIETTLAAEVVALAAENGTTFNRLVVLAIEFYLSEWRRTSKGKAKP